MSVDQLIIWAVWRRQLLVTSVETDECPGLREAGSRGIAAGGSAQDEARRAGRALVRQTVQRGHAGRCSACRARPWCPPRTVRRRGGPHGADQVRGVGEVAAPGAAGAVEPVDRVRGGGAERARRRRAAARSAAPRRPAAGRVTTGNSSGLRGRCGMVGHQRRAGVVLGGVDVGGAEPVGPHLHRGEVHVAEHLRVRPVERQVVGQLPRVLQYARTPGRRSCSRPGRCRAAPACRAPARPTTAPAGRSRRPGTGRCTSRAAARRSRSTPP